MSLTQLPVVPQAPGHPAFYPPDKIPKGAMIAFMPVVILPQEYYANCDDNNLHTANKYQKIDPFPLGVQPAAIPNSFSVHSIFSGAGPKDQCMCPCSCTQNLDKYHKKRETNAEDAVAVKASVETPAAKPDTPAEVKAAAPVAEAATPTEVKVEAPVAEAAKPVEVKVETPVAEPATPTEVKVEAPVAKVEEVKVKTEVKTDEPLVKAASEESKATATVTDDKPKVETVAAPTAN
ncbi:GH16249 [Drosophila grimshawi]|uniref:GH16249 n=2 Tax=Drosophila grimshawi TaxID=7222 RepID=B4IXS4_DROGR|nr:GH16249 [Drosophila grimshawi]